MSKVTKVTNVVLFSGGIDSVVVVAKQLQFQRDYEETILLHVTYESPSSRKELEATKFFSNYFKLKLVTVACPLLSIVRLENEDYIPFRNGILLSYAAAYCDYLLLNDPNKEVEEREFYILIGSTWDDVYPDSQPNFFSNFQPALHATYSKPVIRLPLIGHTKREIVKLGLELDIPLGHTWSCTNPINGVIPCRACKSCKERSNALGRERKTIK